MVFHRSYMLAPALAAGLLAGCAGGASLPSGHAPASSRKVTPPDAITLSTRAAVETNETLYVASEGYQYSASAPGTPPQIFDNGTEMRTFNTSNGDQGSLPSLWTHFSGLSDFEVSPDRRFVLMDSSTYTNSYGATYSGVLAWDDAAVRYRGPYFLDAPNQSLFSSATADDAGVAYFSDGANRVYAYDYRNEIASGPIDVPSTSSVGPVAFAVNRAGTMLYAANAAAGGSELVVYDLVHHVVQTRIAMPTPAYFGVPRLGVLDEATQQFFAIVPGRVDMIDLASRRMSGYIYGDYGTPNALAISHDGKRLYVGYTTQIETYDVTTACNCPPRKLGTFRVANALASLAVNAAGTHLFVLPASTNNFAPATQKPVLMLDAASGSLLRSFPGPRNTANYSTMYEALRVR